MVSSWGGLIGGGVLAAAGIAVAIVGRRLLGRERVADGAPEGERPPVMGPSPTTVLVSGLALLACGYHLVAWSVPAHWFPLRVPGQRWGIVFGASGLAVVLSSLADWLERRRA